MFEIVKIIKTLWKTPLLFREFLSTHSEKIAVEIAMEMISPLMELQVKLEELVLENSPLSWTQLDELLKESEFYMTSFPTKQLKIAIDIFKKLKKEEISTQEELSYCPIIQKEKDHTSTSSTIANTTVSSADAPSSLDFLLNAGANDTEFGYPMQPEITGGINQIIALQKNGIISSTKSAERPGDLLIQLKVIPLKLIRGKQRNQFWQYATIRAETITGIADVQVNHHVAELVKLTKRNIEESPGMTRDQQFNKFINGYSNDRYAPYQTHAKPYNGYQTQY